MSSGFKSELTGCFSTPCDDNPTVAMVEAAYRHHGLNWRYINADVLVNCTSIGLGDAGARTPVDRASLRHGLIVADVIPNPPRTRLLAAAEAAGCTTLDGLGMLVGQGILGIKYWTGIDADAGVMRAALQEAFA